MAGAASAVISAQAKHPKNGEDRFDFVAIFRRLGPYVVAFFILALAVANTGSRGGLIAGITALVAVTVISPPTDNILWRRLVLLSFVSIFVASALASHIMLDRVKSANWASGRLEVYRDTIDMILARPVLGHGAGTFADAYPMFHDRAPVDVVWNRAHSVYLQMAAELGLPVACLVLAGLFGALVYLITQMKRRPTPAPVAVAAVGASMAAAVHSIFDFSVQFQAVGLTLAVLVGAAFGEFSVIRGGIKTSPSTPSGVGVPHRSA